MTKVVDYNLSKRRSSIIYFSAAFLGIALGTVFNNLPLGMFYAILSAISIAYFWNFTKEGSDYAKSIKEVKA